MLRLELVLIGIFENGEYGNTYNEKGDIRGVDTYNEKGDMRGGGRKESSDNSLACICIWPGVHVVPGVAGCPMQDEICYLTVTIELKNLLLLLKNHLA